MTANWIRSSYCHDGTCVAVAHVDGHVHIRDEHGGIIRLDPETWATVVDGIVAGHTNPLPHTICIHPDAVYWTGAQADNPNRTATLQYTRTEWDTFVDGVKAGDFDEVAV